ncbi:MAG: tRNA (adenosine(37)-N6)-dimethylallyltransferase MiaA [Bacteroidales bacterium]|nr:tRNA (adenosine(37)-N6)-dimethylallyltransferase MiaA [Bacteroidales bacterium]
MGNTENYNLIVILGPTASGKTKLASTLADAIGGEIISADSRQVYKKMDIGTGKDYDDYIVNGKAVPFHLTDIHEPGYKYNVYEFQKDFFRVFPEIKQRGNTPILCGGTGMYIEAVTKGYKLISVPVNQALRDSLKNKGLHELEQVLSTYRKLHNKTDTDTIKRAIRAIEIEEYYLNNPRDKNELPQILPLYIGVSIDRETRREKITRRLLKRLSEGMIEEVKNLLSMGIEPEDLIYYGLEYKYITLYLTGRLTYNSMVEQLNVAIHQFAKRQMTWFRKMEREGTIIHWIDGTIEPGMFVREALQLFRQ